MILAPLPSSFLLPSTLAQCRQLFNRGARPLCAKGQQPPWAGWAKHFARNFSLSLPIHAGPVPEFWKKNGELPYRQLSDAASSHRWRWEDAKHTALILVPPMPQAGAPLWNVPPRDGQGPLDKYFSSLNLCVEKVWDVFYANSAQWDGTPGT